jgi:hypothetical protein
MKPAQIHKPNIFCVDDLTLDHIRDLATLPYVEAMDIFYSITGIENSRSKYFTQRKIELWPIMPINWRIGETIRLVEKENDFEKISRLIKTS